MSTDLYRKCSKCGTTAIQDRTVNFYRFPSPGKTNILKAKAWAIFCWPEREWNDVNSLILLNKQSKVLCGRHFEEFCFIDSNKKRIGKFSVPGTREYVTNLMQTLRKQMILESQGNPPVANPVSTTLQDTSKCGHEKLEKNLQTSTCMRTTGGSANLKSKPHSLEKCDQSIMSFKSCYIPGCKIRYGDGIPLHRFPNPTSEPDRFRLWVLNSGSDFAGIDDDYVFNNRRICRQHFSNIYLYPKNRLSKLAVPTLKLQEPSKSTAVTTTANIPCSSRLTLAPLICNPEMEHDYSRPRIVTPEECALGEPGSIEDDDFAPSPVPEMGAESATLFSWQKSELIPADDVDEAAVSKPEDPSGVSLYSDDDVPQQPAPPPVSDPGLKPVECQCKECGETIDGFQFWCVQCLGCALCGACEARGAHKQHYVLRAPPGRPYRQTQVVLAAVRHQLQNEDMFAQHDTGDGVKLEVKEEPPEEEVILREAPPGQDPLAESDAECETSSPGGPRHITVHDQRPFKRPRLADVIEKDFAATKAVRGTPLQVKVTPRPMPGAETTLIDLDDDMDEVEYLIEDELETDDEVRKSEDQEEPRLADFATTKAVRRTPLQVNATPRPKPAAETTLIDLDDMDEVEYLIEEELETDDEVRRNEDEEEDNMDTRIVEEDEIYVDTRRYGNKGEFILSDCVQRSLSSKESETGYLPVRGPPGSMVKTLKTKRKIS